jgi:hypothetical protein
MAPPPVVQEPPAEEPAGLKISAFADAFYGFQTAAQGTPSPWHRAYDSNTFVSSDAYTGAAAQNGFGLSFAGLDASYDGGQLGATINLRAGPSVTLFYGGDQGLLGIDNNTLFCAEVAESWRNLNYTRGGLYYAMQPFWHTGLRATVSPNEKVRVTGMVVNGVNSARDDNETPSLALQLGVTPSDLFALSAGWLTTLNPSSDGQVFDNFFDLVMSLTVERFTLIFNADLSVMADKRVVTAEYEQSLDNPMFWGLSLAAGYQATDVFGIALRGELLSDSDNQLYKVSRTSSGVTFPSTEETNVVTVTGTLDFKPVKGSNNLVIRWDNRIETSNEEIFYNRSETETNVWFESILGVVVSTDG